MKTARRSIWLVVSLFLAMNSLHAERGNPSLVYAGETVDEMVATFMRENAIPGLSLAIVQAPYVTRVSGYGLADVETRLLVASNTMFDVGQMSEAYLAVAVMQLVESGKLKLDDLIRDHVKDLPADWKNLTVLQLLQHQSGLPQRAGASDYDWLTRVIESVSGQRAEAFIRANQFDRLGLKHTFFASELDDVAWEKPVVGAKHHAFLKDAPLINPTEPATGYRTTPEGQRAVAPGETFRIFASSQDISIWDVGLAGEILIKDPALRKILYHPPQSAPSSGPWFFPGHEGLMVATGSGEGFSSLLSRFTKADELLCVTLLVNKEGVDLTQLARQIAGAYDVRLGPPVSTANMRVQQSPFSVHETIDRLEVLLKSRGVGVMARIDHTQGAEAVGLKLRPTQALLFGNPANGTLLMQSNAAVATDLPLRAAAWEENGEVWLAATDPVEIATRHNIKDRQTDGINMRQAVDAALLQTVSGK